MPASESQLDRYAVAGNPVEHSQSPFIHGQFAQATGEALVYERLLCAMDGFEARVRAFASAGARGCNITVPFKRDALRLATRCSPRAKLAEAANVLRFDTDGWWADNTDGIGLVNDIERNARVTLQGARVLLIGAGGAASGALGPLIDAQPTEIMVANRTLETAQSLVARHAARGAARLAACTLADAGEAFDVIINATASSLQGAAIPVSPRTLREGTLAIDMMYGPAAANFTSWAQRHGAIARDGLGMLVEQAAQAFWVWRGVLPDTAPVLDALRERMLALKP